MSYVDFTGKIGNRNLRGESGREYITPALLTEGELAIMLRDGISEYVPPPLDPLTPEDQALQEEARVRGGAWDAAAKVIYGEPPPGSSIPKVSAAETIIAIADLAVTLNANGHLLDIPDSVAKLIDDAQVLRDLHILAEDTLDNKQTEPDWDEKAEDEKNRRKDLPGTRDGNGSGRRERWEPRT